MDAMATHGEVAYEAYREAYEAGQPEASSDGLPPFEELPARVRVAFEAAAQGVRRDLLRWGRCSAPDAAHHARCWHTSHNRVGYTSRRIVDLKRRLKRAGRNPDPSDNRDACDLGANYGSRTRGTGRSEWKRD